MSREYRISWNKSQLSKLNSAVRRYNNALRRANKQDPIGAQFRPSEVSYHDLKAEIHTARQLNNRVNALLRATKPGAFDFVTQDDGGVITRWERREYGILRSVREKQKAGKLREMMTPYHERKNFNPYQHGRPSWRLTPDTRPIESLSVKAIRNFITTQTMYLYEPSFEKNTRYIQNFIKGLDTEFGGFAEFDETIEAIRVDLMKHIHDDDWVEAYIEGSPDIGFLYSPEERWYKFSAIKDYWKAFHYE